MASLGAGYDLSSTTFSPDGRIFQVEYAAKAVEAAGTVVGLRARDGVVLAVEKPILSRLAKHSDDLDGTGGAAVGTTGANRRILTVDDAAGVAGAGIAADLRALAGRARDEAATHRESLEAPIGGATLAARMALFMQAYTLYSSVRPFCATLLLAAVDSEGAGAAPGDDDETTIGSYALDNPASPGAAVPCRTPTLHMIEPSGICYAYRGCASGKGRQAARTEIEKIADSLDTMSVEDALKHAIRILYLAHDEAKDRDFVVEASWIGPPSAFRHTPVPSAPMVEAITLAKEAVAARMDLG